MDPTVFLAGIPILVLLLGAYRAYQAHKASSPQRWAKTREEFCADRRFLHGKPLELMREAVSIPSLPAFSERVPLWVSDGWLPDRPLALDDVVLEYRDSAMDPVEKTRNRLRDLWPVSVAGNRYPTYTSAVKELDCPQLLIDRVSYRALEIRRDATRYTLVLGRTSYFDYLDTGETLAIEFAHVRRKLAAHGRVKLCSLPYRRWLRDPLDFTNRDVIPGICTLTLRQEKRGDTFFMHQRDPAAVTVAPKVYHVAPAGEFQPSNIDALSFTRDMEIWFNIMREYAEEFLGKEEAYGDTGRQIDRVNDEPYKSLDRGKEGGDLRVYFAGFGLDPLNWKLEVLTIVVISASLFDVVFGEMVSRNEEGTLIVGKGGIGLPFDEGSVQTYAEHVLTRPAAMALLQIAWKHREMLLL